MFNLRFILGFAALAFVVCLFAGLLGGIPFGLILFRTLMGTALFALLGVGASWVIQRFIPDLLDVGGGTGRGREETAASGDEVDIMIPEENPHARAADMEVGVEPAVEAPPSADSESLEGDEAEFGDAVGMDAGTAGEPDRGPVGEVEPGEGTPGEDTAGEDMLGADTPGVDAEEGFGDLDSMPSLDSLEGAFAQTGNEQETTEAETTINVMGQEQDTETAAKAIQTWLRKDTKG